MAGAHGPGQGTYEDAAIKEMNKMDVNEFAKRNNLAKKFEKAIETISVGNGWAVFAGLERGETLVKVVYDGLIRFESVRKPEVKPLPRRKKDVAPKMEPEPEPIPEPKDEDEDKKDIEE